MLNLVPTLLISFLLLYISWKVSGKVPMNMTFPAFEWKLLIVQDLHMRPTTDIDFDCLWKTHLEIYFNADPSTVILILVIFPIYEFPEADANVLQGILAPAVN